MYGWRLRIGVMIPSVNTVLENEFRTLAPPGVSIFTTRMKMAGASKIEQLTAMSDNLENDIESLRDVADIYAYGCTSGSFIKGSEWDGEIVSKIEKITTKRAVTASSAIVSALNVFNAKNVALATPYLEEVNEQQIKFLQEEGFHVTAAKGLNIHERGGSGLCNPEDAYRLGKRVVRGHSPDALIISCTNFRTIEVIAALEKDLQIPVITSNQALFWAVLRAGSLRDNIKSYGRLLEKLQ